MLKFLKIIPLLMGMSLGSPFKKLFFHLLLPKDCPNEKVITEEFFHTMQRIGEKSKGEILVLMGKSYPEELVPGDLVDLSHKKAWTMVISKLRHTDTYQKSRWPRYVYHYQITEYIEKVKEIIENYASEIEGDYWINEPTLQKKECDGEVFDLFKTGDSGFLQAVFQGSTYGFSPAIYLYHEGQIFPIIVNLVGSSALDPELAVRRSEEFSKELKRLGISRTFSKSNFKEQIKKAKALFEIAADPGPRSSDTGKIPDETGPVEVIQTKPADEVVETELKKAESSKEITAS